MTEATTIDAEAGYLPPSAEPPPMPEALRAAFTHNRPVRVADSDGAPIPEGGRDAYLASLAGSMRRRGMVEAEIRAALRAANDGRCNPPLDTRDVDRIAWSVSRYAHDDEVLDRLAAADTDVNLSPEATPDEAIFEAAGFGWLDVTEALSEPPPPYDWLWSGLIEKREVIWLSGAGKTGKSMIALSLGLHLLGEATEFLGVPIGSIDNLIYLDAENPEKTVKRRLHLADVPRELGPRIRYGVLRNADLGSEKGLHALELAVRALPGSLLVLDSLIGLHRADEDKSGEVRQFVTGIRKIAEAHDLTVIGLAHESHAGKLRGSTDWGNAADGTLKVTVDDSGPVIWRTIKALNRRDGQDNREPKTYTFRDRTDDNGVKHLDIQLLGEMSAEEQDELERHNRRVERIRQAVSLDPKLTLRALAGHVGCGHKDRPFTRALQAASEADSAVGEWLAMRRKSTRKDGAE